MSKFSGSNIHDVTYKSVARPTSKPPSSSPRPSPRRALSPSSSATTAASFSQAPGSSRTGSPNGKHPFPSPSETSQISAQALGQISDRTENRMLDLALKHTAIIVSPDYRLLPESTTADMLSDLRSFLA